MHLFGQIWYGYPKVLTYSCPKKYCGKYEMTKTVCLNKQK